MNDIVTSSSRRSDTGDCSHKLALALHFRLRQDSLEVRSDRLDSLDDAVAACAAALADAGAVEVRE